MLEVVSVSSIYYLF